MSCLFSLSFFLLSAQVLAFQFSFNPPSQCDDLGLKWTGGTPPFKLHIIPVFGTPRDVSIPDSAFSNGKGSHFLPLPFKKDQQVLFTMSDATGFNAGGSSNVYTVLQSKGGSCNATDPATDFVFQLNSNLQQCRPFTFSGYDGAAQPVMIAAIIPGGTALTMSPPPGQLSYTWSVNVARGTSMIFFMTDAQGRQGGSSDIRSVGASDDSSCLDSSSPSTTANAPSTTQTGGVPQSPSSTAAPAPTSTSTPISAASIAGVIIGSVLFLAVVITLALFFIHGNKGSRTQHTSRVDLTEGDTGNHMSPNGASLYGYPALYPHKHQFDSGSYHSNLSPPGMGGPKYQASEVSFADSTSPLSPPSLYPPQPHHSYSPYSPSPYSPPSQQSVNANTPASPQLHESELPYCSSPTSNRFSSAMESSIAQRKSTSMGMSSQLPSRYILHTDAEDVISHNESGFIELPPQYSERQGLGSSPVTYDTKQPL